MTIRAHLDEAPARHFPHGKSLAEQFGFPPIAPPVDPGITADEARHEAVNGLFAEESDDE